MARIQGGAAGALRVPAPVMEIARTLEGAGFETWCVGGAVRDALLGHPHLDWDLATAARPRDVQRLFRRTAPKGIKYGTVSVLDAQGTEHEVTTFRRDVRTDGRHAEVEFGASLEEDLARRDFTINAIAVSPLSGELRDPFHGRDDLARGIVRAVGRAADRLREDRLRALRAIRFASRFGFVIEPETWRAIVSSAPELVRLSRERVQQELEKTMEQVATPSVALRLWRESGALGVLIPPLAVMSDTTLVALDSVKRPDGGVPRERVMRRLVVLFSDLQSAEAGRTARSLRFSNSDADWVASILERWHAIDEPLRAALAAPEPPSDRAIRALVGVTGRTRLREVLRLAAARCAGADARGEVVPAPRRMASLYRRALRIAFRDPVEIGDLAVNGVDLQRVGIPPGPRLGWTLRRLLEDVLQDPARNVREPLLARAVVLQQEPMT